MIAAALCALALSAGASPTSVDVLAPLPLAVKTDTYIKAGRFFDGVAATARRNVVIVVRADKIVRVGDDVAIPPGAAVIDLSDRTVLPGLIDAHTHIALHAGDYDGQILRETPEFRALWAAANARRTLEAGVTTIRDLGNEASGYADIALRDAVALGLVAGPRVLGAIHPVTSTGAYRLVGYSPYLQTPALSSAADGVGEARKETRRLLADGADVIKIYMESYEKKALRPDLLTGAQNYSREELAAIVEEAHRAHVKVAAHTYSDEAAQVALDVGVDSIEHGLYLSEATFRRMAKQGVWYVPTLMVYEYWRDGVIFAPVAPEKQAQLANTVREHTAAFQAALKTPVHIAFGTDTFERPGSNPHELVLMVKYGMPVRDALHAATAGAAELLGVADVTGTIAPGKAADIIALDGDPFTDIGAVERVRFVMKGGAVFVNRP